jgi:hypothetical protein
MFTFRRPPKESIPAKKGSTVTEYMNGMMNILAGKIQAKLYETELVQSRLTSPYLAGHTGINQGDSVLLTADNSIVEIEHKIQFPIRFIPPFLEDLLYEVYVPHIAAYFHEQLQKAKLGKFIALRVHYVKFGDIYYLYLIYGTNDPKPKKGK